MDGVGVGGDGGVVRKKRHRTLLLGKGERLVLLVLCFVSYPIELDSQPSSYL